MPTIKYRLKDGTPVTGVTTIMDQVFAKPALIPWAFSQGMENLERLSRIILSKCDIAEPFEYSAFDLAHQIQDAIRSFQPNNLYEKRDRAADAGTLAHAMVEHDLKGLPPPDMSQATEEVRKKAEGCYLAFLEWKDRTKFKLTHSEISLVSEILQFGGTLDIGGGISDLELIDLKSSKGIYYSMWIQVAGYAILWDEIYPENKIKGYNILRIGQEGNFMHERRVELDDEKEIFLHTLGIHWKLKTKGVRL
jgi:hypothetical protein